MLDAISSAAAGNVAGCAESDRSGHPAVADSECLDSKVLTDHRHLQLLSPAFASTVDVVLWVTEGETAVELPAHSTVLSGHSPVMCDLLQSIRASQSNTRHLAPLMSKLRVPMIGDSLLEVHSLLDMVYLPIAADIASQPGTLTASPMAVTVAHRYGMTQLVADIESKLIREVESACATEHKRWSNGGSAKSMLGFSQAASYAAAADKCDLKGLKIHSEAYIVQHFDEPDFRDKDMGVKLSGQSLFRIARGLADSKAADERDLSAALSETLKDLQTILVRAQYTDKYVADCPRKGCKGFVEIIKVSKRGRRMRCNIKDCDWPSDYETEDPSDRADKLRKWLSSWQ